MDVIALRNEGIELKLDLSKEYIKCDYKILVNVCNGVGPAWFSDWLLEAVTDYFEYFLPSTNQHDFDFEFLPKTKKQFKKANRRVYKNMKRQIIKDKNLRWFSIGEESKWRKYTQARFLYKQCVLFGKSAFFKKENASS